MFKFSVIIPTYNRAELLEKTLIALTNQTLPKSLFEVIVVDDGGSDNSYSICDSFKKCLNIRYYWQYDNGFRAGKARNLGISVAEGEYLLFIDSGILLHEDALNRHLHIHTKNNHPVVCIGYVYAFEVNEEHHDYIERIINPNEIGSCIEKLKDLGFLDIRQIQYDEFGYNVSSWPAPFDILWTCHVSVEKKEAISAGLFDESFNTWGGEDVDLGVRLHQRNNRFIVSTDLCSIHSPHKKEVSNHDLATKSAGAKIHDKYKMWQTAFYMTDSNETKFSLNKIIYLYAQDNVGESNAILQKYLHKQTQ
ncbi:glycosyltransferase [Enterobacter asburiae]|uniref:glycosyltransferase n=1 Tax=Enterobacter asburiae TaxID=61645 RepID=UPI00192B9298|nr:glycosyltransferase [Enterobacter asburiae]MBL5950322.1 glycosyltransferase [Enterobacter asburiae]